MTRAAESAGDPSDVLGLEAGLAALSGLVTGVAPLEELLTKVADFAVMATPGADGAGVTVLEAGRADTLVASAEFVREVDTVQYRLGEGPCISAASSGVTTGSAALGEDASWPTFGPMAADLGVHSAISFPLILDGETVGALNVYAHRRDAFDGSARAMGEQFAGPAAVAVHNARALDRARRAVDRLEVALASRSTIDQAIGILMARSGISAEDAFVRLRIMSQHQHVKLAAIAATLVAEAVRRANARRPTSER